MTPTRPTVVVTGVSSGIGRTLAGQLAQNGYFVFGSVRRLSDADDLTTALKENFSPLEFDMLDKEKIQSATREVSSKLDGYPLAGLINNAGHALFGPMEWLDNQEFEQSLLVNVSGTRNVTNAFLPMLRSTSKGPPGKIINISSLSGIVNTPMNGAYCVAKHGVESLGEIYRRELLPAGIDVVSIRSGPIQSRIWSKAKEQEATFENSDYQQMADNARKIMRAAERDALPASVIAERVHAILSTHITRSAYHIGKGAIVSRILAMLPPRISDKLITGSLMKGTSDTK